MNLISRIFYLGVHGAWFSSLDHIQFPEDISQSSKQRNSLTWDQNHSGFQTLRNLFLKLFCYPKVWFRMLLLLLAPLALVSAAPGSSKCTWGPSYWCANLPQVLQEGSPFTFLFPLFPGQWMLCCEALHQGCVGERDGSSGRRWGLKSTNKTPLIICMKIVCRCARSARRWLERQETPWCPTKPRLRNNLNPILTSIEHQEELREVFDGSCDLIPVGLISKECKALVEQFVPELVETLASEMNPDT